MPAPDLFAVVLLGLGVGALAYWSGRRDRRSATAAAVAAARAESAATAAATSQASGGSVNIALAPGLAGEQLGYGAADYGLLVQEPRLEGRHSAVRHWSPALTEAELADNQHVYGGLCPVAECAGHGPLQTQQADR